MTKKGIKRFLNESSFLGVSFRNRKYISLLILDFLIISFSLLMAYLTRFLNLSFLTIEFLNVFLIYVLISFSVIFFFKLYDFPVHSQDQDIFLKIDFIIVLIFLAVSFIFYERSIVARSIPFIALAYKFIFSIISRYFLRKFIIKIDQIHNLKTAIIIGNNEDSKILKNLVTEQGNYKVRFFYSSTNTSKKNNRINFIDKIPVYYSFDLLIKNLNKEKISKIYFTEELQEKQLNQLKKISEEKKIELDFAYNINNNLADHIFNLNINTFYNEIFNKEMYGMDLSKQNKLFKNKNILITGGAGTIGNAIYEQLKHLDVNKIHIIDNSEIGIFNLNNDKINKSNTVCHLGSINDENFLENIFKSFQIDIIFHAAAYKHVSIVQNNLLSAINNNIFGTEKILDLAIKYKINNFILISSDKAVEPSNYMGITKRICELLVKKFQNNQIEDQKLISVRFGNVAGSSGSVIPIFLSNIKSNKDLIVNDEATNRYFMSSMEAAYLVTLSLNVKCNNGDILFFDMGESFNIKKLAEKMLSMFPSSRSKIKISKIDKSEKISERLTFDNEIVVNTEEQRIFLAKTENTIDLEKFTNNYSKLKNILNKKNCTDVEIENYLKKCIV